MLPGFGWFVVTVSFEAISEARESERQEGNAAKLTGSPRAAAKRPVLWNTEEAMVTREPQDASCAAPLPIGPSHRPFPSALHALNRG